MPLDPRTPVVVGVGQVTQRAEGLDDAVDPVGLMVEAIERASVDAGLGSVPPPDAIRVVNLLSWPYRDPAFFVAQRLGLEPRETGYTTGGGNTPQWLLNATANEIQRGELDLAILAGGETWRTRMRATRSSATIGWDKLAKGTEPGRLLGDELSMNHPGELARGITAPIQLYPLFESALRASAGRGPDEHLVRISELWATFSRVAAGNPYAWSTEVRTAEEIRTPGPTNRMIGLPYPKLMNSNNDVDQAAALLVCSVERARVLGVPDDRWVFPHAGADCHEHPYVSNRWTFTETPAIRIGGRAALDLAGIGIDDVEVVDLYSCFPSAVQLGAASLGLSADPVEVARGRPLTRTGGLTFAGGPWNNYVMHAIATVVGDLRARPDAWALVWGNGGYATKHSFGVYRTTPPDQGFRHAHPQDEIDGLPSRELAEPADASGPATVEGYTVMHDREGRPERGIAACLLADGRRAWGTTEDVDLAGEMCEGEWVGRAVRLSADGALRA